MAHGCLRGRRHPRHRLRRRVLRVGPALGRYRQPVRRVPADPRGHRGRLVPAGRARAAGHPQARLGGVHRDGRGGHFGTARYPLGSGDHPVRPAAGRRRRGAVRGHRLPQQQAGHGARGRRARRGGRRLPRPHHLIPDLAGLLTEDSGERAGELSVDGRAGILFQDPQTQLVMARCGDDVAFGPENLGVPAEQIWPRVSDSVGSVGFGYPLDRSTHALSGGEQQRLALAGVLATRPSVLLLDEPTANLDPDGATLIRSAIARLDTTLVLVEHRVAEALPLVNRVVVLTPEGVVADGAPSSVFKRYGDELAEGGVWVPGHPVLPRRAASPPGVPLLAARAAAVAGRLPPTDLDVCAGEALAVCGPNGAGKSTLARLLGGLTRPTSGRVTATRPLARRGPRAARAGRAALGRGPPYLDRAGRPARQAARRRVRRGDRDARHRLRRGAGRPDGGAEAVSGSGAASSGLRSAATREDGANSAAKRTDGEKL